MENKVSINLVFVALLALPLTVGCSNGFETAVPEDSFDYTFKLLPSQAGDGEMPLDDYSQEIRSFDLGKASTGGLGFGDQVSVAPGTPTSFDNIEDLLNANLDFTQAELTADLLMDFGMIQPALKMGHHLARVTVSERCASLTGEVGPVDPAADYNCGETPYGEILPDGRKRVFSITTDEFRETGDPEVYVPPVTAHLYLHRNQTAGLVKIDDLDTLKRTEVTTGSLVFD
ncbi:MAG: hypothetical protein AAF202_01815, partial [Pseudomonadota bacterium]